MEETTNLTKHFSSLDPKRLLLVICVGSIVLGAVTGFFLSQGGGAAPGGIPLNVGAPKAPEQDSRTFRDFAEGTIKIRPEAKGDEYAEGTHTLQREGAVPVALTSSVVDLSLYEGKKVKVYGETQKALKEGWLMDVGKVEEIK